MLFGLGVPLALLPVALLAALGGFGHPHWPLFLPAEQRMDFARGIPAPIPGSMFPPPRRRRAGPVSPPARPTRIRGRCRRRAPCG
ncbi:hypothetical protein ACFQU2_04990 [Siccirubricoccus deserti]